jgi:crotonobetainyl-CoA:carnitine CoA-transferase CaiB-like acyl-CoA transferase
MSSYTTSDGAMIQLMILNPEPAWPRVCQALDMADLEHDPRYATHAARIENADTLVPVMQAKFASRPFTEWKPILEGIDVPWEKIASIHDVAEDPQAIANGMVRTMDVRSTPIKIVAGPTAFDGELFDHEPVCSPPLGAHTAEVLAEAGYTADQISDMQKRAVAR